jgi:hypothetical protein
MQLRRLAALTIGLALSILGRVARVAPAAVLGLMFRVVPSSPVARHVWSCNRHRILNNLRASGYDDRPEPWLLDIGRRCAAEPPRNYAFMYLSTILSVERLGQVIERVFDRNSAGDLAGRLDAAGATIGVFLHGPLCVAVPNLLRTRGQEMVRVVVPRTHGINISELSRPLQDFFGDSPEQALDMTDHSTPGALLRHLEAGRSVYVALDELARGRRPAAVIEMLGQRFPRNDGPAWLAVRSGRPVALCTTHCSRSGITITASPVVYPDLSLPVELRVAALSERLYAYAESAIRAHPEAWGCWNYLDLVKGDPR